MRERQLHEITTRKQKISRIELTGHVTMNPRIVIPITAGNEEEYNHEGLANRISISIYIYHTTINVSE